MDRVDLLLCVSLFVHFLCLPHRPHPALSFNPIFGPHSTTNQITNRQTDFSSGICGQRKQLRFASLSSSSSSTVLTPFFTLVVHGVSLAYNSTFAQVWSGLLLLLELSQQLFCCWFVRSPLLLYFFHCCCCFTSFSMSTIDPDDGDDRSP